MLGSWRGSLRFDRCVGDSTQAQIDVCYPATRHIAAPYGLELDNGLFSGSGHATGSVNFSPCAFQFSTSFQLSPLGVRKVGTPDYLVASLDQQLRRHSN